VWSIPTLTIILLGGVAWIGSHQLDPAVPVAGTGSPVRVQVVSLDWKWLFIYRGSAGRDRQCTHRAGRRAAAIGAHIVKRDNAFFIPQLGSMIYTMNGMVTHLNLRADQEGKYQGLSAHFFPAMVFPEMMFDVHVVSALDFPNWVGATAKSNNELTADTYKRLMEQSVETGRPTYRLLTRGCSTTSPVNAFRPVPDRSWSTIRQSRCPRVEQPVVR